MERHFFRGDGGGGMGAGLSTLYIIHEQDALKQQGSDMPSICFYNIVCLHSTVIVRESYDLDSRPPPPLYILIID